MEAIDLEEGEIAGESSCLPENALEEEVWAALQGKEVHARLDLVSVSCYGMQLIALQAAKYSRHGSCIAVASAGPF